MSKTKESLSKAFKEILDYASEKLGMNLGDYTFHVARFGEEGVGVIYFPNDSKAEHVFINYNTITPDPKIGHTRGNDILIQMLLKNIGLEPGKHLSVSVNGDPEWEYKYPKEDEINPDFTDIERTDDGIRGPNKK